MLNAVKGLLSQYHTAAVAVTGHSLGAAQATLAHLDIRNQINPSLLVFYSFGSPRPGNQAFSDYLMTLYPAGLLLPSGPPERLRAPPAHDCHGLQPRGRGDNDPNNPNAYKVCANTIGKPENPTCSDSVLIDGVAAHKIYMGIQASSHRSQLKTNFFSLSERHT
jgi:hypothetical protein